MAVPICPKGDCTCRVFESKRVGIEFRNITREVDLLYCRDCGAVIAAFDRTDSDLLWDIRKNLRDRYGR
jgi:hypothetical protein